MTMAHYAWDDKNPDFSLDSTVLVLAAADPNAKPVPVPNFTGSSEVLGAESAEPLPKTAPEIVKKNVNISRIFYRSPNPNIFYQFEF